MSSTIIPPPYKGQNDQFPLIAIQSPYAERVQNFNNKKGSLNLRNGNDRFATLAITTVGPKNIAAYGTSNLFLLVEDPNTNLLKWYDVTAGGVINPATPVRTLATGGDDEIHTLFFRDYLFYFGESGLAAGVGGPQTYNGSAWALSGYTWPASFNPFGGCVHKNRGYFINRNGPSYGYSPIDSPASGTITEVNLSSVVSSKANIYAMASLSMTENITADNILSIMFANGEILIYGGAYPDSASWNLISRFQVSPLLYNNSTVYAKGDTFILTQTEILSLRGLFANGYEKERTEGIGAAIKNRWQQVVQAHIGSVSGYRYFFKGVYDEKNDRLVIQVPLSVDYTTGSLGTSILQLIYDFTLGGWYEYLQSESNSFTYSAAYFNSNEYFLSENSANTCSVMKLEGTSDFIDDKIDSSTVAIAYDIKTAPLPISKFGANAIDGVEIICKSDLYPQTNYKFIADLGRQTTEGQPLEAQGTTIAKPMANVGIQGATAVQLEVSGSSVTASVGLELYGFNVWYNQGKEGAR